jgi:hypothetical protein
VATRSQAPLRDMKQYDDRIWPLGNCRSYIPEGQLGQRVCTAAQLGGTAVVVEIVVVMVVLEIVVLVLVVNFPRCSLASAASRRIVRSAMIERTSTPPKVLPAPQEQCPETFSDDSTCGKSNRRIRKKSKYENSDGDLPPAPALHVLPAPLVAVVCSV